MPQLTSTFPLSAVCSLICCATWGVSTATAQTAAAVSGIVTDMSGLPLAGAHVQLVNSPLHTLTDDEGRFSLRISARPVGKTLLVSHLGMLTRRVRIAGTDSLHIRLEEDTASIPARPRP